MVIIDREVGGGGEGGGGHKKFNSYSSPCYGRCRSVITDISHGLRSGHYLWGR